MIDLHPSLRENLSGAVDHIFAAKGERPGPHDVDRLAEHLFQGMADVAGREGADWSMTWGHLIGCFLRDGASLGEATDLAMSCFMGAIMDVCDDVRAGRLGARVDSLEKLEVHLRWTIDQMLEADLVTENA